MASVAFPNLAKSIKTKDGTTYGLVHVPAKDSSGKKPTLLFLHGYPSSSYDWRNQIDTFSKAGYEIIVPDLLGYGDTDKPTSIEDYSMVRIAGHVEEICDKLHATERVVAIAHDWGSSLLSTMVKHSQQRYIGFVFVAVGYSANALGNLDDLDAMIQKMIGRSLLGYWRFHEQEDAADVIANNAEAYLSLLYPEKPEIWISDLSPPGKARAWTETGEVRPLPHWLPKEEHELHVKILQKGGWTAPLNWYRQAIQGVTRKAEENLSDEQRVIQKPVFYIGASKDFVGLEDFQRPGTQQWAKNGFETVSIDAGHWVYIEKRKEFDDALMGWLNKTFPGSSHL